MPKTALFLSLAITFLAGCASGVKHKNVGSLLAQKTPAVVILEPFVRTFEIGLGQQPFRTVAIEKRIQADTRQAFALVANETRWFKAIPEPAISEEQLADHDQLSALLLTTSDLYTKIEEVGGPATDAMRKSFKGNIGKHAVFQQIAKKTNARYGLLLAAVDNKTTGAAKAVAAISNAATMGNSTLKFSGTLHALVCVIDLENGDLLWFIYEKNAGSLDSPENIAKVLKSMLSSSPLAEGKS